ncbi:Rpn family recombination-promoting nuclease/putative transposase [Rossellomorea marisflavi]|uniref:Rpn family recombination-promoting nuclease/putative transposase n=1 Tax=Rossellomorea marisflavi TaxID=189381 RepID=UPI003FA0F1EC
MEKYNRLKPVNDVVFKKLFGDKVRKASLISFLNAVLSEEVEDVEVQEEKLDIDTIEDKPGILDLKAVLKSGEKVNIEVQQLNQYNMTKRTLFYWSKLYTENFKKNEKYSTLQKTIAINILGYSLFKRESFQSSYHIYEDRTFEKLNDDLEIHFLELPVFKETEKDTTSPLHRWLLFLTEPEDSNVLEEIVMMDEVIRETEERLNQLSADPETRRLYELREKKIRDDLSNLSGAKEEGKKEGMEIGERMKAREVAKKLLNKGMDEEEVSDLTGIPLSDLKKL